MGVPSKATVAGFAWWHRARFGTSLTCFVAGPHEKLHPRPQWQASHVMWASRQSRRTPHTFRGPIVSSTEGPSGRVCMLALRPFWHTPHTCRAPVWDLHRSCYSQLRYSQLHMFGSSAKIRLSPLRNQHFLCPGPLGAPRCPLELLQDCLREPNSITRRLQEGPRRVLKVFIFEPCSTQARSVHFGGPLGAPGSPLELLQDCLRGPSGAPRRLQDGQALDASLASWVLACLRAPRPRMPGALPGRMISLGPRL